MSWELFVGLRYLRSRRSDAFVSVITLISTLGVLLGVMVLTMTLAIMTGFEEDLRARILGLHPHLRVTNQLGTGLVDKPDEIVETLKSDPRVEDAAAVVQSQMLASSGDTLLGVFARGIDAKSGSSTAGIDKYVVEGSIEDVGKHVTAEGVELPTVMIGRELAGKLFVERGEVIRLMSPRFSASPMGAMPRAKRFVVAAIFDSGMVEYDSALVFMGIDDARALFGVGRIATGVEARLYHPYEAPEVAASLSEKIPMPYAVEPWTEAHRNVFAALKLEKTAYFLILLLIILVAAFTIVSTLYMVVMEKRRDIAVLKTMGADDASIARIFVMKGLLIGGVGTSLGAIFGWLGCLALSRYEFIHLPEGVFYVKTLPVRMEPENFLMVVAASMVICLGACLFPAWKAARVVPVDVLRYE
ncbi:MAG TPA: ABC transporter permease [Candidatus Limnocylindrales bacterium]|nr:ABC transporter permease [Candidatus Limnocylindrales bacterium]